MVRYILKNLKYILKKFVFVPLLIYFLMSCFSFSYAVNNCLTCHGDADKLKTMIKDEDFNKGLSEGYG